MFSCEEGYAFSSPLLRKRSLLNTRPSSYLAAINNSVILTTDSPKLPPSSVSPCFTLPREIWLLILVNYGLSGKDLANLELSCKWFTECWEGNVCYAMHLFMYMHIRVLSHRGSSSFDYKTLQEGKVWGTHQQT